jgi:hypothetical protein
MNDREGILSIVRRLKPHVCNVEGYPFLTRQMQLAADFIRDRARIPADIVYDLRIAAQYHPNRHVRELVNGLLASRFYFRRRMPTIEQELNDPRAAAFAAKVRAAAQSACWKDDPRYD